jgi:uncharacterized YceG family protein
VDAHPPTGGYPATRGYQDSADQTRQVSGQAPGPYLGDPYPWTGGQPMPGYPAPAGAAQSGYPDHGSVTGGIARASGPGYPEEEPGYGAPARHREPDAPDGHNVFGGAGVFDEYDAPAGEGAPGAREDPPEPYGEFDDAEDDLDAHDRRAAGSTPRAGGRRARRPNAGGSRRGGRRRGTLPKLLALLTAVAVVLGGGIYLGGKAIGHLHRGTSNPDYPGPGSGGVTIQIAQGATAAAIAKSLFDAGVVKSEHAFIAAATNDPNSVKIQPGTYRLKKQMSANEALGALLDPSNAINRFTIPEGMTADWIITQLAAKLGRPKQDFQAVLDSPAGLGLPSYAGGKAEGYLFPSTYALDPNATPTQTLKMFVDEFKRQAAEIGLDKGANGMTPGQIVTIASIIQMEVRNGYEGPRAARVIYNRLNDKTGQFTTLGMDSTLRYGLKKFTGPLTKSDRASSNPYNTNNHPGLPPTAVANPGVWALSSALQPYQGADGTWMYFATMPDTGNTEFANAGPDWDALYARYLKAGGTPGG